MFKNWVTRDVLPSIRKNGVFKIKNYYENKLNKLEELKNYLKDNLKDLKNDNRDLKDNLKDLKNDNRDLKDNLKDLKNDNRDLKDNKKALKRHVENEDKIEYENLTLYGGGETPPPYNLIELYKIRLFISTNLVYIV
ncbi:UNVERIFIED_CONTAM: hypothetical protein RMT77_012655 [Armadillidium vulgare]